MMNTFFCFARIAFVVAVSALLFPACENSGDDVGENWSFFNESGKSSSSAAASAYSSSSSVSNTDQTSLSAPSQYSSSVLTGVWRLSATDGFSWYIHFADDGSWKITDDVAGTQRRTYGSYTLNGTTYSGDMKNPGVGEGSISGTIQSGTSISLDFCEYWHTPYKHVAYTGTKL